MADRERQQSTLAAARPQERKPRGNPGTRVEQQATPVESTPPTPCITTHDTPRLRVNGPSDVVDEPRSEEEEQDLSGVIRAAKEFVFSIRVGDMMEVLNRFSALPIGDLSEKALCKLADEAAKTTEALLAMESHVLLESRENGAWSGTVTPRQQGEDDPRKSASPRRRAAHSPGMGDSPRYSTEANGPGRCLRAEGGRTTAGTGPSRNSDQRRRVRFSDQTRSPQKGVISRVKEAAKELPLPGHTAEGKVTPRNETPPRRPEQRRTSPPSRPLWQ